MTADVLCFLAVTAFVPQAGADDLSADGTRRPATQAGKVTREQIKDLFQEAVTALREGRLDAARRDLLKITEFAPNFGEPYRLLGFIYLQQSDPEQAVLFLEKAVQSGVRNADVFYTLASIYVRLGDFERAEPMYLEAVKVNPRMAAAYHDLGLLYYQQGRNEEAVTVFLKALTIDKTMTKTMLSLGMSYVKLGKPEMAVEYVTSLRACGDELKATHLEGLIRGLKGTSAVKEPDASNLIPDIPAGPEAPVRPATAARPGGKTSLSGKAQVLLQAKAGEQSG